MLKIILRTIVLGSGISLLALCIHVNYVSIVEYFGSNAPYYGLTTNMDKWHNPVPFLILVDVIVLGLLGILSWVYVRLKKGAR